MVIKKKLSGAEIDITNRDFFDNAGLKYEEAYGHAEGVHSSLKTFLELLPRDGPVLDCGSGTGYPGAVMIATDAKRQLHGIDFSPKMVQLARSRVPTATFEHANMLDYEPATKFAGIVAILSLFELTRPQLEDMARKWASWLNPNGILLIGVFAAEDCRNTPEMFDGDGKFAGDMRFIFMKHETSMNLFTRQGWKDLLSVSLSAQAAGTGLTVAQMAGLKVLQEDFSLFKPPPEAESEDEPYFSSSRRRLHDFCSSCWLPRLLSSDFVLRADPGAHGSVKPATFSHHVFSFQTIIGH